jgi:lipase maturation factor 1
MERMRRVATVRNFLRILGAINAIAFVSFGVQALGLVGSHGILPVADFLQAVRAGAGSAAYFEVPTLLWLNASDAAISALWIAGALLGLAAAAGFRQRIVLAACLILWLSVCAAGQEFFAFQWDYLLAEAGFLAIFADRSPVRVWLFRWLIFRLIFFSGVVKLASGDPTWRGLTALDYHYETQPLPTPPAWLMHQLPGLFQKISTAIVLFAELIVPFLFFGPRRVRHTAAAVTIGMQVLILITGNYTFFNLLTIGLCLWLFIEPDPAIPRPLPHRVVSAALAGFIALISSLLLIEVFNAPMPSGGAAILHAVAPLRLVNSYGLFAVMTTTRLEILVEGSNDGENWLGYEFRYKPGDPSRGLPIVAPHQPRLDWQMWFAALGTYQQNRWFVNLMVRLLQGERSVLGLLRYNPFPGRPPKYVRARAFQYHFTHFGEAGWWRREERGMYFPPVSLK